MRMMMMRMRMRMRMRMMMMDEEEEDIDLVLKLGKLIELLLTHESLEGESILSLINQLLKALENSSIEKSKHHRLMISIKIGIK